jgi:Ca2+-transporting ATPase
LTEEARQEIELENERLAGNALRVLGFAFRRSETGKPLDEESGLIWVGLAGMADPVREGVRELIQVFHRAGVRTVMITGDQSATAYAVAREVVLSEEPPLEILDSTQIETFEAQTLQALAKKVHVYSRVSPAHKLRIVQALQSAGLTVAMTGDGINDGPALKASNIGIAMGETGTDVAREVADVVLEGDDLELLILALQDGRMTYSNIRKAVHFFLSTNLSEIIVMFVSLAAGLGFPLNVMQLLWINIISDIFPGLALSREDPEPDLMEKMPRDAGQPLFSAGDFKKMARESALISAGSMAAYAYGISRYGLGAQAGSLAFQSLTIGQLLHAYSCRSEDKTAFSRRKSNHALNLAVGGSLGLQLLTMVIPGLRSFLGLGSFSLLDAAVAVVTAILPFVANESMKGLRTGSIVARGLRPALARPVLPATATTGMISQR